MPDCRAHTLVGASLETVWAILLDKVEHPHRYIEGVLDGRVLARGEGWVRRELELPGGVFLQERVEVDERARQIQFILERHPHYRGRVMNHLRPTGDPERCELAFEMHWEAVADGQDESLAADLVRCALERTRVMSEEVARMAEG